MTKFLIATLLGNLIFPSQITAELNPCDLISASEGTTATCSQNEIVLANNSFEEGYVVSEHTSLGYSHVPQDQIPAWNTTASDGVIELWNKDAYTERVSDDVTKFTGEQIAELNATQSSSLYQDFETIPGQTINISLDHGGRYDNESLYVIIGEPNMDLSSNDKYPTSGDMNDIVATSVVNSGEWEHIAIQYEVPAGQTTTRIAFGSDDAGSMGNFLDNIKVGVDALYDNTVSVLKVQDTNSYIDDYLVASKIEHVYGDGIGKFLYTIDMNGLDNPRAVKLYDKNLNIIPLDEVQTSVVGDSMLIEGESIEEGYVTFIASSNLEQAGEIEVKSQFEYLTNLTIDINNQDNGVTYAPDQVTDISKIDTRNYPPSIDSNTLVYEEEIQVDSAKIIEDFNIVLSDYEDDFNSIPIEFNNEMMTTSIEKINFSVPATYEVPFVATDSNGQATIKVETVTIDDVLPQIETTSNNESVELGESVTEQQLLDLYGVVATEITTGDLTKDIEVDQSALKTDETGKYPITFTVSDEEGNTVSEEVTIEVERDATTPVDPITPEIEVNNPPQIIVSDENSEVSEESVVTETSLIELFGITIMDPDGNLESTNIDYSNVNMAKPGVYSIKISAEDDLGLTATYDVDLTVTDVLPQIETTSNNESIELGESVTEQQLLDLYGVVATEITTGDLTKDIEVDQSALKTDETGKYPITFTVSDEEGNTVSEEVTIEVERDTTTPVDPIAPEVEANNPPQIIVSDENSEVAEESVVTETSLIELFGITITDPDDNLKSSNIDYSNVNMAMPGVYSIELSAEDDLGLTATYDVDLTVTDVLPEIETTSNNESIESGESVTEQQLLDLYGVVATEITTGDLTKDIEVDQSALKTDETGKYPITFTVSDEEGNTVSEEVTIEVERDTTTPVDTIAPEVEANNPPQIIVSDENGEVAEESVVTETSLIELFGITITDPDGNLKTTNIDYSNVNMAMPGVYSIEISAEDDLGLTTTYDVDLTVTDVLPQIDTTSNNESIELGESVTDQQLLDLYGVVATEITTGDLTKDIEVDQSALKTDETGKYPITFIVSDEEGNTVSEEVTIEVERDTTTPVDTIAPEIEVNNPSQIIVSSEVDEEKVEDSSIKEYTR